MGLMVAKVTDPDIIAERLHRKACIECGLGGMEQDLESGFAFHYCVYHRNNLAAFTVTPEMRMTPADREAHRKQGIENLDRLMRGESLA